MSVSMLLMLAKHMPKNELVKIIRDAAGAYLNKPTKENEMILDAYCILLTAKKSTEGKSAEEIKKLVEDEDEVDRIKERLNKN